MRYTRNRSGTQPLPFGKRNRRRKAVKSVAILTLAACALAAGCATYTERVVEKPVPARTATTTERTVYTDSSGLPATATTVYTTR
jgi:hypothetical protein